MIVPVVPVENSGSVLARSDSENLFAVMKRSLNGDAAERECALYGVVAVLPGRQARGADVSDRF
jgi:hypothetical protein